MTTNYDAIVVGARCADSPTAMLLARKGYKVLLVDKATFPSDTLSTHFVHAPGVAALERWGLRDALVATGCPAVTEYRFDFGFFTVAGRPRPTDDGVSDGYAPRRHVIDTLLVDAAADAGVDVRTGFSVDELVRDDAGAVVGIRGDGVTERARVVIGADGRRSVVAKAVRPEQYNERPTYSVANFAYFSGLDVPAFGAWIRERRAWGAFPTHDGLTVLVLGWPEDEYKANRGDVEGNFYKALEQAPEFAEQVRDATRETRFWGIADLRGYFRKPFGDGWALVGDAGYHKHPVTAKGMSDSFLDAERLSDALDQVWAGGAPYGETLAMYQKERDEAAMAVYEMTCQFASMEPPPAEMQQVLAACAQDQAKADAFASMQAGTLSVPEFFAEAAG